MNENLVKRLMTAVFQTPEDTGDDAEKPAIPILAEALLEDAAQKRVTDIHLDPGTAGCLVRLRIDGAVLNGALLSEDQGQRLVNQFRTIAGLDPVTSFRPQDARFSYELGGKELDVRLASAPTIRGEKLAIRVQQPQRIYQEIGKLGLADKQLEWIRQWLDAVDGMFLVTGPTASGKTTTLYTLLQQLRLIERSIVTIEDPVEYDIDGVTQLQVNEDQGLTFSEGVKSMLRLDPDYLLIGEVRDLQSARAAADAAASGRVLLSTLHSRDAVGTVTSLRNWELEDFEIATILSMVVGQRLVRKLCSECRKKAPATDKQRHWLQTMGLAVPEALWQAQGCPACDQTGYYGQTGVFEVWRLDDEDRAMILNHATEQAFRTHLAERGHRFLLSDAAAKIEDGVTNVEEIRHLTGLRPLTPHDSGSSFK